MFGILNSKNAGELALVFDVRSSSVGGALVRLHKRGVPSIVLSLRESIMNGGGSADVDKFLFSTSKALDAVASKIFKAGLGAPTKIFCILSSPWHISQTRIINLKKDKPFSFSLALADDLIKKEVLAFKEEHLAPHKKTKHELKIIELQNLKTMLNGYETYNPLDQKVEEVEMTLLISMSPEQVLSSIENVIKKYFHHETIKFASHTLAYFSVIRNLFMKQENFILIDVGGEVTELTMIKKNVLCESGSFPIGHLSITRGLASFISSTEGEATSYLTLLNHGHAEVLTEKKLKPIIDQLKMEWLKNFQESLANLSKDISVPYTIYLSVHKDFMNFFAEAIKAEQFNQYTLTESKFEVILLNPETLHGLVLFEKDMVREPYLMIDSAYINHFLIYPAKAGHI